MAKNMTTEEVIRTINGEGGFNNFRNWNKKEIAEWVFANYPCSKYVANKVAQSI